MGKQVRQTRRADRGPTPGPPPTDRPAGPLAPPRPRRDPVRFAVVATILVASVFLLGPAGTVVAVAFAIPPLLAPKGRRVASLAWVAVLYPLYIALCLYALWASATWALWHAPRPVVDDPRKVASIAVPYVLSLLVLCGTPVAAVATLALTAGRIVARGVTGRGPGPIYPMAAVGLSSWVGGYLLIQWDPFGVLRWYAG